MAYFKIIDKGKGINRLFIGGVHGKEGLSTVKAIQAIQEDDVGEGKLTIHNCDESPYLSTLNPLYYKSELGKEVLYLINYYKPQVYVEAHCYKQESYHKLIDPLRRTEEGVPPLIELEKGVLIGSASPNIRTTLFKRDDVCITLEMPCNPSKDSLDVYVKVLRILAASSNRDDLEKRMKEIYPSQLETARNYAREFFGDYPPF
ncbi:MAG TPA: DUF2119 domain-containing protein [Methanobacterium subterraneum]|uniref:DUF2119 domain-containing protein n=1 Tax=Methanobacterium subterraneum TaxID=59277 RepID=A0A7J4TJA1_9EURY|nr:DUF2119 domain-containing protein [Methanobacterium subterraneum]